MKRETALPVLCATTQLLSDSSDVTKVTLHYDIMTLCDTCFVFEMIPPMIFVIKSIGSRNRIVSKMMNKVNIVHVDVSGFEI